MMLPRTERSCYHSGRTHLSLIKHTRGKNSDPKTQAKPAGMSARVVQQSAAYPFNSTSAFLPSLPIHSQLPSTQVSMKCLLQMGQTSFLPRHMNSAGGESLAESWQFVLTDSLDTMQRKEVKNCTSSSAVCLQPIVILQAAFLSLQTKWFAHSLEGKQLLQVALKHVYDLTSAIREGAKLHTKEPCSGAKTCVLSPVKLCNSIQALFKWRQVLLANLKKVINLVLNTAQSLNSNQTRYQSTSSSW